MEMSEPMEFVGVPKPLLKRLASEEVSPSPGSGRIRFDLSVNVWTLVVLGLLLVFGGVVLDRINAQVGELTKQMATVIARQSIQASEIQRLQTKELLQKRDMRNYPLHRHFGANRMDIYPPRDREVDEQMNKED